MKKNRSLILFYLAVVPGLFFRCHSPENDRITGVYGIHNIPVITGIIVSPEKAPFGNGDVYGTPSYTLDRNESGLIFNAVPNSYLVYSLYETHGRELIMKFINLPKQACIEIYRGVWAGQHPPLTNDVKAGGVVRKSIAPIRTLRKNNETNELIWDLRNENGNVIRSGFYRAYLLNDTLKIIDWVDLYIITPVDCSTWIDPTGFLPEDWNIRIIQFPGGGADTLDVCALRSQVF